MELLDRAGPKVSWKGTRQFHSEVVLGLFGRAGIDISRPTAELLLPGLAALLERVTSGQALTRAASGDQLLARRLVSGVVALVDAFCDGELRESRTTTHERTA